jgi:hypothetical protein
MTLLDEVLRAGAEETELWQTMGRGGLLEACCVDLAAVETPQDLSYMN